MEMINYEKPLFEVIMFECIDIVTTSGDGDDNGEGGGEGGGEGW